jgi:hypothetical protein
MYSNGSFCLSVYGVATAARCAVFVAMLAGFIDSLAGGGGLLTIPALMAAGCHLRKRWRPISCRPAGIYLFLPLFYSSWRG